MVKIHAAYCHSDTIAQGACMSKKNHVKPELAMPVALSVGGSVLNTIERMEKNTEEPETRRVASFSAICCTHNHQYTYTITMMRGGNHPGIEEVTTFAATALPTDRTTWQVSNKKSVGRLE